MQATLSSGRSFGRKHLMSVTKTRRFDIITYKCTIHSCALYPCDPHDKRERDLTGHVTGCIQEGDPK